MLMIKSMKRDSNSVILKICHVLIKDKVVCVGQVAIEVNNAMTSVTLTMFAAVEYPLRDMIGRCATNF